MNYALVILCCASVSSGFSGKPSGEWIAQWLETPYRNEASICRALSDVVDRMEIPKGSLVIDADGSYWDSYDPDCTKGVKAVEKFFSKSKGSRVVVGTVPDRNAGGFYRMVCGANSFTQVCREPINESIRKGCTRDCVLVDADAIYEKHEIWEDIHLKPEVWKEVARDIMEKIK